MDFQKLLLDAGKALCKDEVKALAFLCADLLGGSPNSVESASDLFSRLADQDHLSAERPHLLTELLLIIQRARLVHNLRLADPTRSLISPYRKLLYNLSEDITDDDLKDVKFLLNKMLPRRKLEDNVTTLEVFLELEHMDLINNTDLNLLETILLQVCPVLKEKINQFKAQQETCRPRSVSHPREPNQVPQPLGRERTLSCEESMVIDLEPLAKSALNSSNTSMDFPNSGDGREALSHGPTGLSTKTMGGDALVKIQSPEKESTSEKTTSQTTSTNTEVLGTYPMTAAKRGICLIVNNYDFTNSKQGLQKREGTMVDEECLHKVFKWLGFEIEVQQDCRMEKMLSVFRELGGRDHSQMDCVVCCVLSHGQEGSVYAVDGHAVDLKQLREPFNGLNCPSLAEKPKLFFIQACQGTSQQKAVYIEADGPAQSLVYSDAIKAKESIPSEADFLQGMATVPSCVSFRERKNGTWFIQTLCQNLVQMVPRGCDLVSILTKVNADVSQRTDYTGLKKQMPQPSFSLRRKVVFPIPKAPPPSLSH